MRDGSDPYKPFHFLKQCTENFHMKYVNCFKRLRFLAEVSTKLYKIHFSRQIIGHNSERKLKNQTNDLIFSSTFSTLFVILIFVFENSQNSFSCGRPFDPFWFVKFRNFQQKLPIWTIHHTFIESKHPEVARNPCYVLSPEESQKPVSARGQYVITQSNP